MSLFQYNKVSSSKKASQVKPHTVIYLSPAWFYNLEQGTIYSSTLELVHMPVYHLRLFPHVDVQEVAS